MFLRPRRMACGLFVLAALGTPLAGQTPVSSLGTTVQIATQAPPADPVKPNIAKAAKAPPHAFWDRKNVLLFSGMAAVRGMDYASTRNFQARGRTEILLPDDVVNNSAGFASLEAASVATSVGISYLLHRIGHHKMERWLSVGHMGVTAFGVAWNYSLESKHPR